MQEVTASPSSTASASPSSSNGSGHNVVEDAGPPNLYRRVERQFRPFKLPLHLRKSGESKRGFLNRITKTHGITVPDAVAKAWLEAEGPEASNAAASSENLTGALGTLPEEVEAWKEHLIDVRRPKWNTKENWNKVRDVTDTIRQRSVPPTPATSTSSSSTSASTTSTSSTASSVRWLSPHARVYSFPTAPGLFLISGALDFHAQAWWAWRCLQEYSDAEHNNLKNLDKLQRQQQQQSQQHHPQQQGMGQVEEKENDMMQQQDYGSSQSAAPSSQSSASSSGDCMQQYPDVSTSPSASSSSADCSSIWSEYCSLVSSNSDPSSPPPTARARALRAAQLHSLRWSCLGFHYDWTARTYSPAPSHRSPFPPELAALSAELAAAVGFDGLTAEAAICNYYPVSSCMNAHVDDAELTKLAPIVSISLGCAAVFMLGGRCRSVRPLALLVRSGDVVVMGGESRVCLHSVPRILDGSFGWDDDETEMEMEVQQGHDKQQQQADNEERKEPSDEHPSSKREPWTPELAYSRLRFRPASTDSRADSATATPAAAAAADSNSSSILVPDFPSSLPQPSRLDLLSTFTFLFHARINVNVRQVEGLPGAPDESLSYRAGLDSTSARAMTLEQQRQRAERRMRGEQQQGVDTDTMQDGDWKPRL